MIRPSYISIVDFNYKISFPLPAASLHKYCLPCRYDIVGIAWTNISADKRAPRCQIMH